jgi:hypothetical protein
MTPSERLELGIFHFSEPGGKAQWQPATIATISTAAQVSDWPVVADALHERKRQTNCRIAETRAGVLSW